jgi:hypothetical protein
MDNILKNFKKVIDKNLSPFFIYRYSKKLEK